jgi:hypothetical protein
VLADLPRPSACFGLGEWKSNCALVGWPKRIPPVAWVSLTLFAFSRSFVLSFVFLALVDFCQIAERALSNTTIQIETPPNLLGSYIDGR